MSKKKKKKKMGREELVKVITEAARTGETELHLSGRGITELPEEIGQLRRLTELHLGVNQLTELPKEMWQLTRLTGLWLNNNQLTELPKGIGQLASLTKLDLNSNQLTELPKEIWQLMSLIGLCLNNNQLTELPKEIWQLTSLAALWLHYNQLTELPAELGGLENLGTLRFEGNPLESPPPEIVGQGTKAVLAYLREMGKGEGKRYQGKLLLLGDGEEGKTCVSRALRGLAFEEQETTRGVRVIPWEFDNPNYAGDGGKRITLNHWDFEGQEINHQTHQFFLTEQSLYLLVFKCRELFRLDRAEYWLDMIRARAPQSRVMLVITGCEERMPFVPLDKLKAGHGDLLQGERIEDWFFSVGCATGKGIDELREMIQKAAANMELMGMRWPTSYQRAEDAIEQYSKTKAHIGREELYGIICEGGVDEDNLDYVAEKMHLLGVITQFADSPELVDFVVLQPQWLTKAISYVMEDEKLSNEQGEIRHERMQAIWEKNGYKGLFGVFHTCMKEFELCYDMEDQRAACLVPLRFSPIAPGEEDLPWSADDIVKERRVEYKMNIRPPFGLMSRFIVKTHHMNAKTKKMEKGVYWHNGVFLRTGEGALRSEALCVFDAEDKVLKIQVRAAFPQLMIEQLNGFVKAVFSFYQGLKPDRGYGCVKFINDTDEEQCEGVHGEKRLFIALRDEKTELDCAEGDHYFDPTKLVYGFVSFGEGLTAETMERILDKKLDEKLEFIERSVKDFRGKIDGVYSLAIGISEKQEALPAELAQEIQMQTGKYLRMMDRMLDDRDFTSAPGIVGIGPLDGGKFSVKGLFEREYVLTPYCECEGGIHRCTDASLIFKMPREWFEKAGPNIAVAVKWLGSGIKLAAAVAPIAAGAGGVAGLAVYAAVKSEVDFMKALADHLDLKGGAVSDVDRMGSRFVREIANTGVGDLRGMEGEERVLRAQLTLLLENLAPDRYKARSWGKLRRVLMGDDTYRWLCEGHAKEYED